MTVWKSAAVELVVGTAARLAVLEWPISEADFPAKADEMGWDAVVPGLLAFHSGLGVSPDLAMATGGALSLNRTDSMVSIRVDSLKQVHVRGVICRTEAAES